MIGSFGKVLASGLSGVANCRGRKSDHGTRQCKTLYGGGVRNDRRSLLDTAEGVTMINSLLD
jgi:hypothetical protein